MINQGFLKTLTLDRSSVIVNKETFMRKLHSCSKRYIAMIKTKTLTMRMPVQRSCSIAFFTQLLKLKSRTDLERECIHFCHIVLGGESDEGDSCRRTDRTLHTKNMLIIQVDRSGRFVRV